MQLYSVQIWTHSS